MIMGDGNSDSNNSGDKSCSITHNRSQRLARYKSIYPGSQVCRKLDQRMVISWWKVQIWSAISEPLSWCC